jgi:hypothetical protein
VAAAQGNDATCRVAVLTEGDYLKEITTNGEELRSRVVLPICCQYRLYCTAGDCLGLPSATLTVPIIPLKANKNPVFARVLQNRYAVEWIRTTTVLLPPAPQAGASASSATTAL